MLASKKQITANRINAQKSTEIHKQEESIKIVP